MPSSRFKVSQVSDSQKSEPALQDYGRRNSSAEILSDFPEDGAYAVSLRHLTVEALPRIGLYSNEDSVPNDNARRPTLDELHDGAQGRRMSMAKGEVKVKKEDGHKKFGWIQGVLILNIMNLWGPMLFLRTSWLVGQGGIIQAFVVILFSALITTITALSTSAIATNGEVKGGGTYYMLSRSLGPEYGGAIGLIFAFANMVGVAMNIVGFCESLNNLLGVFGISIVDGGVNDTRVVGTGVVIFCTVICLVGMEWVNKLQTFLLLTLLTAITDVVVGSFMPVSDDNKAMGITGWSLKTIESNLFADYRGQTFASIFAVYFPSATGILAGANVSGELKDPQTAIPKGTLLAILLTSFSYLVFAAISGGCVIRDASGNIADLAFNNFTNCHGSIPCKGGLENTVIMLELVAAFRWLVYAGNFAATISSALACFVGAPRVFQALCRDNIYPGIHIFAKGFGKNDEPIRSYFLTFIIALAVILIGDLNAIASIMSNFFMAAFCLINFACFHAALAKSPGFRPSFHWWNKWVSLLGALLCLVVMFVMDWITGVITIVICFMLYIYLYYKRPDVNWGSSAQADAYRKALKSVQELNFVEEHVKNYRPQLLVMTGKPCWRPALVDFAYSINKGIGIMICGHVVKPPFNYRQRNEMCKCTRQWLRGRKNKSFYSVVTEDSLETGAKSLLQLTGVGKLRPNIFLMGYKDNWQTCDPKETITYFNIIHNAFDMHMGVGLLRMPFGLDYSYFTDVAEVESPKTQIANRSSVDSGLDIVSSSESKLSLDVFNDKIIVMEKKEKKKKKKATKRRKSSVKGTPKEILNKINYFSLVQNGTIDVWWLYDDGGLTILIPDILSKRKQWQKCKLRIFSMANRNNQIEEEQRNMAAMLGKFRIECENVHVLPGITNRAKESTKKEYYDIVSKFMSNCDSQMSITEEQLIEKEEKINRLLRIREMIIANSLDAAMILITLPMPRRQGISAALYMSWLEILTMGLPPCLLIRGNQKSVLTYYS